MHYFQQSLTARSGAIGCQNAHSNYKTNLGLIEISRGMNAKKKESVASTTTSVLQIVVKQMYVEVLTMITIGRHARMGNILQKRK